MTEIFTNVRPELKKALETAWQVAKCSKDPMTAATFLDNATRMYEAKNLSDEEKDFIHFYFNLKIAEMENTAMAEVESQ